MRRQQRQRSQNPDLRARSASGRRNQQKEMEEAEAARSGWAGDAVLDFSLHSREMDASAGAWNFGLCATRSREPRQARKGATVPGSPRVPQTTRSASHRKVLSCQFLVFSRKSEVEIFENECGFCIH